MTGAVPVSGSVTDSAGFLVSRARVAGGERGNIGVFMGLMRRSEGVKEGCQWVGRWP